MKIVKNIFEAIIWITYLTLVMSFAIGIFLFNRFPVLIIVICSLFFWIFGIIKFGMNKVSLSFSLVLIYWIISFPMYDSLQKTIYFDFPILAYCFLSKMEEKFFYLLLDVLLFSFANTVIAFHLSNILREIEKNFNIDFPD